MTRIVVDPQLAEQIRQATEGVELVDATGRVLASFRPNTDAERTEPTASEDELRRREKSGPWFTTCEVLERQK